MTEEIVLPTCTCNRCHHTWIPRQNGIPLRCGKCNSPYWNRPRTRKIKSNGNGNGHKPKELNS